MKLGGSESLDLSVCPPGPASRFAGPGRGSAGRSCQARPGLGGKAACAREARAAPWHLAGSPAPPLRKYLEQRRPPATTGRLSCACRAEAEESDPRARPGRVLTRPQEAQPGTPAGLSGVGIPGGALPLTPFSPRGSLGCLDFRLLPLSPQVSSQSRWFTALGPGNPQPGGPSHSPGCSAEQTGRVRAPGGEPVAPQRNLN